MSILPENDDERAECRLFDYELNYFPNAQVAKARHSYRSNLKHTGEPGMTWAHEKSIGDGNQIRRHLLDAFCAYQSGDSEIAEYHLTALAWRADELLERFIKKMPPFNEANTPHAAGDMDATASPEPAEDNEILCFDAWCKEKGFRRIGSNSFRKEDGDIRSYWTDPEVRRMYAQYVANE